MASLSVPTAFTEGQNEILKKLFGEPAAQDARTKLYDAMERLEQAQMRQVVRAGKEPVTAELHGPRERKTLADGTTYEVDERGCWRRVHEG